MSISSSEAASLAKARPIVNIIQLTRFTNSEGALTKRFVLCDGSLVKETRSKLWAGRAERLHVADLSGFAEVLRALKVNQALAYGVSDFEDIAVVTKGQVAGSKNAIARTAEYFTFAPGAGILFLDGDADHFTSPVATAEEYRAIIIAAIPELAAAPMVLISSASSHIYERDKCHIGTRGFHAYVWVADASDNQRAGRAIYERLWAAGHGSYWVSKAGVALDRNIIDASVLQAERLDFASGAECVAPLVQRRPEALIINGGSLPFDSRALREPTLSERAAAVEARAAAKLAVADEVRTKRAAYLEARAAELSKLTGIKEQHAREVVLEALEHSILYPEFVLYPEAGEPFTVGAALRDRARYHGSRCADPLEPDYRDDRRVAFLNLESGGRPSLYSHAHGGRRFELSQHRVVMEVSAGEEPRMADAALRALRSRGGVYEYGSAMARVADGRPIVIDVDYLNDLLGRCIRFKRFDKKAGEWRPTKPPADISRTLLARTGERNLPRLTGIITAPTLRADGSVLATPGFDNVTGLLYLTAGEQRLAPLSAPTIGEARTALVQLWEPFSLFPFDGDRSRAVVLAAVLTAVVRLGLETAPGFGFDAPDAGSGKTLLARSIGALTGQEPQISASPTNDDEQRKSLFAHLRGGAKTIIWDNLVEPLDGAPINAFLTSPEFSDRVLGISKTESYPNRALFMVTANNLRVEGDTCRRILVARIEPGVEAPFLRRFYFDPYQRVRARRQSLVVCALTIIRARLTHCPEPIAAGNTASFEAWDQLIRQTVAWLASIETHIGLVDPCEVLRASVADDPRRTEVSSVLRAWHEAYGDSPRFLSEVWSEHMGGFASADSALSLAIGDLAAGARPGFNALHLSKWLANVRGKIVDGMRFDSFLDSHRKIHRWFVKLV